MAAQVLTNCAIYAAQADLSGKTNRVALSAEVDVQDTTTFGSGGYKSALGGLKKTTADIDGYFEALDTTYPDERLFTDIGSSGVPHTFIPNGGADGDLAYFFRSMRSTYSWTGQVGAVAGFTGSAVGDGQPLVRGTVLLPNTSTRTSSSTGTGRQLGAVSSTQRLYAVMHCFAVTGGTPSMTAVVQSDNGAGFGTPATALSFSAQTTIGSQFVSAAGPITDDYFRISYTISGSTPVFTVSISVGIL